MLILTRACPDLDAVIFGCVWKRGIPNLSAGQIRFLGAVYWNNRCCLHKILDFDVSALNFVFDALLDSRPISMVSTFHKILRAHMEWNGIYFTKKDCT